MRVIVLGDKSRYQFLRSLNPEGINNNVFNTENLAKKDIYMSSVRKQMKEGYFYSRKIPLNTELIFVNEINVADIKCEDNDKLLIFDEFPFRTETEIAQLRYYIEHNNVNDCVVVLVNNNMDTLKTDVTNMQTAVADAIKEYEADCFPVFVYTMGMEFDFLFGSTNYLATYSVSGQAMKILSDAKLQIEVSFDGAYRRALMFEAGVYPGSPDFVSVLGTLTKFDIQMKETSVFCVLEHKVCNYLWDNTKSKYLMFATEFYQKKVKEYLGVLCKWDLGRDLVLLQKFIQDDFLKFIHSDIKNVCVASDREYEFFKDHYKGEMDSFRNKIMQYFNEKLKTLLKERICKRIEEMEKIIGDSK